MTRAIRLLTFDLDNTLWDADPVLIRAENILRKWLVEVHSMPTEVLAFPRMLARKQQLLLEQPELVGSVSGVRKQVLRQLFLELGHSQADSNIFAEEAFQVFYQARQQVQLFDDVLPLLENLSKEYTLASLSNGNASTQIIGLQPYFALSINGDDVYPQKPAPDMFLKALSIEGIPPAQSIHIGDHLEQDVWAAQQVGMKAIWVNLKGTACPNNANPDAIVETLTDLPKKIAQLSQKI